METALEQGDVVSVFTHRHSQVGVWLQRQAEAGLLAGAVVEPAPPVREVDHPPALRRSVCLGPVLVPLVRAGREDHTWIDFEWHVEMLELWNDIPFQVLT